MLRGKLNFIKSASEAYAHATSEHGADIDALYNDVRILANANKALKGIVEKYLGSKIEDLQEAQENHLEDEGKDLSSEDKDTAQGMDESK